MEGKILLKDIFQFDALLARPEFKGRRIKLRFNKNWGDYNFVVDYINQSDDFLPWILSDGSEKKSRNRNDDIQFQFIEVEYHKWLFVGAYLIKEKDSQVKKVAYGNRVEVAEIANRSYFEKTIDFPGYENLSMTYEKLKTHWNNRTWREHLSTVYGVYLITDTKTGKLYVGSAYGENGVYGRWSAYLNDGYDKLELEDNKYPNKRLKEIVDKKGIDYIKKHFQYSILEIFSKSELGKQKALNREKYWKKVLQSREFGYNAN